MRKGSRIHLTMAQSCTQTYHAHTLQVHFSTPQLLPAVMAVTLALGQAAEVTCELKDITYKGAPTYLISWHLQRPGMGMKRGVEAGRKMGMGSGQGGGKKWIAEERGEEWQRGTIGGDETGQRRGMEDEMAGEVRVQKWSGRGQERWDGRKECGVVRKRRTEWG